MTTASLPQVSADQPPLWQQGALIELTITDLSDSGDGVGRYSDPTLGSSGQASPDHGSPGQAAPGRVVFVPDSVTGDRLRVRLVRVKKQFAHGKIHEILTPSPHRVRPSCIVADKCGGCQWQHVSTEHQRTAKYNQVVQALERIGGFSAVAELVQPVIQIGESPAAQDSAAQDSAAQDPTAQDPNAQDGGTGGYRNKVTFPLGRNDKGYLQAGYFQKGSHQLVNLNQCPIQAPEFNPLMAYLKKELRAHSVYNEATQRGLLRHLSLRIGRRTGDILVTLVTAADQLRGLKQQAAAWMEEFPQIVGVCLNVQPLPNNTIFGDQTRILAGDDALTEVFAGLVFQIHPTTFFQVHTECAEAIVEKILQQLDLQGTEVIVDAYCGIGTLTLPLAQKAAQVIGLEMQPEAIAQAQVNARLNEIENVEFLTGSVEALLPQVETPPDVVVLDPPRKGCDGVVIEALRHLAPERIVYMSCNPATLARDLKLLCEGGLYTLQHVQPADFFPQTAHVESAAFLQKAS
jgi:23S rRNA (uracil1939-C5)-methyltransferase